jgi:hypothetical protein
MTSFFSCLAQFAISDLKWEQRAERRKSDELSEYLISGLDRLALWKRISSVVSVFSDGESF